MIWRDGDLPEGAPSFDPSLSYDLISYGDALLSMAIRLREGGGSDDVIRAAFEQAGNAIEATVTNSDTDDPRRGFHKLLAASAFHLGHYSARAFSLLASALEGNNLSMIERALALLIIRSLDELDTLIAEIRHGGLFSDQTIARNLDTQLTESIDAAEPDEDKDPITEALDSALTDCFAMALSFFLVALEAGEEELVAEALEELQRGLDTSGEMNLVPQWWVFRLAKHLVDDLWNSSFHVALPLTPSDGDVASWQSSRDLLIASLYRRKRAEIELWPSQLEAAARAVDMNDNLVVSLPTSAGKTRVAELCILRCLSEGKRVIFVTPLRALSAQTENTLKRTFGPLGRSISTLYGSIGTSGYEQDALRSRDIVVATPEKLDFALRSDPSLLDDVGLVVLDEGHMIGLGEREVRYEVQIQRLLKREDASDRRIVCLSAILPTGEQFDDFVAWIRRDTEGDAVTTEWRPTRLRFGEVLWRSNKARLELKVGAETPFVPSWFGTKAPTQGRRRKHFPNDKRELVLATAWRLVEEGQTVLIYCPVRRSVEPFAKAIVDLFGYGLLDPVFTGNAEDLASALTIGKEWLGEEHPILKCLEMGVAIHHGALPTPFRKEVERLIAAGALKITISSPTLAQGLNLSATTLVVHSLHRNREIIPASEFRNVVGRAGRAFIDIEGLILYPIFDNHRNRKRDWERLISDVSGLEMESGLLRLVVTLLDRMNKQLGEVSFEELTEYVMNHAGAWELVKHDEEGEQAFAARQGEWNYYLSILDTALLALVGDQQEVAADQLAQCIDDVLASSLWQRRLSRRKDTVQDILEKALESRAKLIWGRSNAAQRRGYFLAGVGLNTGEQLDAIAGEANKLLVSVNGSLLSGESGAAIEDLTSLARMIFQIEPFVPDPLPDNWEAILRSWLQGEEVSEFAGANSAEVLRFIETGLIYRLPWGMEAVRVRAQANGEVIEQELGNLTIDDFEVSLAAPAIETGTTNLSAALLMQAGFTPRLAAIKAVEETNAGFTDFAQLRAWLASPEVLEASASDEWPTPSSRAHWLDFMASSSDHGETAWRERTGELPVQWNEEIEIPEAHSLVKIRREESGEYGVLSPAYEKLGVLEAAFDETPQGLFRTWVDEDRDKLRFKYFGPSDVPTN